MDAQDVQVIVQALTAGASSGALEALTDQVKDAIKGAYAKLRGLVQQRVADNPGAQLTLAEHEANPEAWGPALAAKLTEARVGDDVDIVAAAKALLELLKQANAQGGTYNVKISGGQGIQVGSGNTQTNTFNNR
jgi:hypothetical protein